MPSRENAPNKSSDKPPCHSDTALAIVLYAIRGAPGSSHKGFADRIGRKLSAQVVAGSSLDLKVGV